MRDVTVQRLQPGDERLFGAMNQLFARAFEDPASYADKPPGSAYIQRLLGQPHIHALVATENGDVVGALVAYELEKFEQERREIYIYDLAVAEEHRRKGIATALIEHLRHIARAREAWVIYVQADYGDDPAIALYTKLGTREDVLHFDIAVETHEPP